LEPFSVHGVKGECKDGYTQESYREGDQRESRSSGIAIDFHRRDDVEASGNMGSEILCWVHTAKGREWGR